MFKEINVNQSKILEFMKTHPNDATYNIVKLFEINGHIDAEKIKESMEKAAEGMEALKTNFLNCGDYYLKNIEEERVTKVEIVKDKSFIEIIEYTKERTRTPFDEGNWPLLECKLFICGDAKAYFLFAIPHLIADAYSAYLLFDRFNRAYDKEDISEKVDTYEGMDFSENMIETARTYFEEELSQVEELELKQLRQNRTEEGLLIGESKSFYLSNKITKAVREVCRKNNVSTFAYFVAIYSVILNKLTREKKLVIGVPFSGRISRKERNIFDYMVNTLPLFVRVEDNVTVSHLAKEISKKIYKLMKFQQIDFDALNTKFVGSPNNIITVHKEESLLKIEGCNIKEVQLERNNIMCELQMVIAEEKEAFRVDIQYGDFFKDFSFEDAYETVIASSFVEEKVALIKLADEKKLREIYANVNSYNKYDKSVTVDKVFRDVVLKNPKTFALTYGDNQMSYEKLDQESEAIACFLQEMYPEKTQVAYSVDKDEKLISIMLGIVKAGKICVPLDLYNPKERTEYILGDLENVVYIHEDTKEVLENKSCVKKTELFYEIDKYKNRRAELQNHEDDGLYMIYTSGTTGYPKGVVISHKNLLSLIDSTNKKFDFTNQDVWTLFHSYGFDFSAWEIYGCLLSGGRLVITPAEVCKSIGDFYRLIVKEKVTVLNQTPTAFGDLIDIDSKEQNGLKLRVVVFGGEKLNFYVLGKWLKRHPLKDTALINMYGITETTIHVTYHEITEEEIRSGLKSNIGKPLSNLGVYIIDENMNVLPKGVRGEIAVYGDGLSQGYYKKDVLTASKFLYIKNLEKKVYLSGDLGYLDSNGDVIYIDRKDKQIQLRGHRIEKEEIEQVIVRRINANQCVVFVDEGVQKEERLVAVYSGEERFSEIEIKNKIKSFLPVYMIPSRIAHVDKIPKNNNGKVDIKELKALIGVEKKIIFTDETTQKVYNIIKDVTGISEINEDENLFDIGINSVHLPEISKQLEDKLSVSFEIMSLFKYSTIEKISSYVKGASK